MICSGCQQLESMELWCFQYPDYCLNGNRAIRLIAKYSPPGFRKLTLHHRRRREAPPLFPSLEYDLMSWASRTPKTPLSLFIVDHAPSIQPSFRYLMLEMKKFEKLEIIKEFEIVRIKEWSRRWNVRYDRDLTWRGVQRTHRHNPD
jgi:hypothetical protein